MINRILVLVYREDAVLWYDPTSSPPTLGVTRQISCNHTYLGVWGINMQGEQVELPTTTTPPAEGTGSAVQSQQALVRIGLVWVDSTYFADDNFKVCVKVKDMLTNIVSFVDATSYNDNIAKCNLAPYANFCPIVTGLQATPAAITASTSWTPTPGGTGAEWVNSTSATPPSGSGTFTGSNTQVITGLTASTTYYFWIRSICPGGVLSAWTYISYTTT